MAVSLARENLRGLRELLLQKKRMKQTKKKREKTIYYIARGFPDSGNISVSTEGPRVTWILGREKIALHEICVSGTVEDPLLTRKSPT